MLGNTYQDLRARLSTRYSKEEARAMALRLLEHYTGLNQAAILAHPEMKLDLTVKANLLTALDDCLSGQPLQYVLGETEFYGYLFKLSSDVLIPRPETEELVDWVVKDMAVESPKILDIGTGSGCIAVSLACSLPAARVFALDISEKALAIAQENARLNLAQVQFILHDILSESTSDVPTSLDVIVSNPPYICDQERALMHDNVLLHEPRLALFVDNDRPFVFYEAIARFAQLHLKPSGTVYVEINENFGQATMNMFRQADFQTVLRKDLFGKDRMIKATRG